MSFKQKVITSAIWSTIQDWVSQAISFLVFSLLARLLDPESFGLISLATLFIAFINLFVDQGLSTAIIQRREIGREHLDTAFWSSFSIAFLMTLTSIASAGVIGNFYNQPNLTPVIRWLSLSFLISSLNSIQSAIFQRNLDFKPLAIRSSIATLGSGVVAVNMALMGFGVWSLVGLQLSNGIIQVIVLWSSSDWRPGLNFSKKHFSELFSFGINDVGIKILDFGNRRSDDLLIGYFLGPTALGYYSLAYRVLLVTTQLLTGVTSRVALPAFSKIQDDPDRIRNAFYKVTRLTSFVSFPIFMGTAALAPELVRSLFGEKWLPSVPVMQILSFIGIIHSVTYFNGSVIMAMGKPSWRLKLNAVHCFANVIGFVIAVKWGIVAVASVYVIRSYMLTPLDIWVTRKLIGISWKTYANQYFAPLIGSLGMVSIILITKQALNGVLNTKVLLLAGVLIGVVTYLIIISVIAPKVVDQVFFRLSGIFSLIKTKTKS